MVPSFASFLGYSDNDFLQPFSLIIKSRMDFRDHFFFGSFSGDELDCWNHFWRLPNDTNDLYFGATYPYNLSQNAIDLFKYGLDQLPSYTTLWTLDQQTADSVLSNKEVVLHVSADTVHSTLERVHQPLFLARFPFETTITKYTL
jgi:hypothetical protein